MAARPKRQWIKTLATLAVLILSMGLMLRWFEYNQVYHPTAHIEADPAMFGLEREDVWFVADDGTRLNGWFFRAEPDSPRNHLVVLICHGNGGNISHRIPLYQLWLRLGLNVFAFDYRGYGQSGGRPSEQGTYEDAQAAYRWLRRKRFEERNVIVHGESLGGGIASELAIREQIGGLVLHSAFSSVPDLGAELFAWLPVRWLASIKYDTRSKLSRVQAPVLIVHSRSDSMIRFHHAEALFKAAPDPKLLREVLGDHNDQPLSDPEGFTRAFEDLLNLVTNTPDANR